ncbi:Zn(2)-C6 fungal-type domain-containing protein [Mycena venus]|uniref:Zn(2)-C6 fungal-type domain-containing protein n=1 Tax=Mycena venus TaxID=2733690 RepID=A0A8H6Z1W0_9AGAR|nr:Zn(2)-C6 fungal-type domain-containing protein [Mycena venus]
MPKGTPNGNSNGRTRGPYSTQACAICRAKKSKCDGVKPVCGSCGATGRDSQCSWGRDTDSWKTRTESHFEALRKRTESLQVYVNLLEGILANCVCQDVPSHLQFRPQEDRREQDARARGNYNTEGLNLDEEITHELIVPAPCLKFDDNLGGLLLHGITAPFRFGSKPPNEVSRFTEIVESENGYYVLLVDGADLFGCNQDIDWSRHLPREVAIERKEHDKILDLSFKFFTTFSLRIVPSLFLKDMYRALSVPRSQRPPRTPHYSPMLHNALLAVSLNFSDDVHLREPRNRQYFINLALDSLQSECRKPDLSLIHALAFLGTFYADVGDRILADLFFGMSSRVSMSLGLGADSSAWVRSGLITPDEMLARNRVYWTTFSLEVCWALYFGREFCGSHDQRTVPMPFVDEELDRIPWFHPPAAVSPQPCLLTRTFLESSALLLIAREIINTVIGLENSHDTAKVNERVTKIDLQLNNWKNELPLQLDITLANRTDSTPHRLMLHCEYWWCFIVLHRPFFNRHSRGQSIQHSDREIDHVKLCKRAADNILLLVETWASVYTLRYTPVTLLQVLFSAGTIYLLLALQATAGLRIAHGALQPAIEQAGHCIRYLHEMGRTWKCAARTGDILQILLHDKLGPIITRRLAHRGYRSR